MITATFSKLIRYGINNQKIKRAPAITTVEKIVSGVTRMIIYPILLTMDAYMISCVPIILGIIIGLIVPTSKYMVPIVFGIYGATIIFTVLMSSLYIGVFGWIFYDYWYNKLYIWQI